MSLFPRDRILCWFVVTPCFQTSYLRHRGSFSFFHLATTLTPGKDHTILFLRALVLAGQVIDVIDCLYGVSHIVGMNFQTANCKFIKMILRYTFPNSHLQSNPSNSNSKSDDIRTPSSPPQGSSPAGNPSPRSCCIDPDICLPWSYSSGGRCCTRRGGSCHRCCGARLKS